MWRFALFAAWAAVSTPGPGENSVTLDMMPETGCYVMTAWGTCGPDDDTPEESAFSNEVCKSGPSVQLSWQAPTECIDGSTAVSITGYTIYLAQADTSQVPAAPGFVTLTPIPSLDTGMALTDNLEGQWDVNTRGRTDDDFYDHVNSVAESSTGSPSVVTGDGSQDGLSYDGTNDYTDLTVPGTLSSSWPDNDFTIAVRFEMVSNTDFEMIFGGFDTGERNHILKINDDSVGSASQGGGTDIFPDTGAATFADSSEHVAVFRRSGNEFSLWVDGTEYATSTVTIGARTPANLRIADSDGFTAAWVNRFSGDVFWAAIWDRALSDTEIGELDDSPNPFISTTHEVSVSQALQPGSTITAARDSDHSASQEVQPGGSASATRDSDHSASQGLVSDAVSDATAVFGRSVSQGLEAGGDASAQRDLAASISAEVQTDAVSSVTAEFEAAISQAVQAGVSASAFGVFSLSLTEAIQMGGSADTKAAIEAAIQAGLNHGATAAALAVFEVGASQGIQLNAITLAGQLIEAAVAQGMQIDGVTTAGTSIDALVEQAMNVAGSIEPQMDYAPQIEAGMVHDAVSSVLTNFQEQIAQGLGVNAEASAGLQLETGISAELVMSGATGAAVLQISVTTPDSRKVVVALENRMFEVPSRDRRYVVPPDDRDSNA